VLRNFSLFPNEIQEFVQVLRRDARRDVPEGDNTAVSFGELEESTSH